ncbi:major royal jelly family protein [Novacetimonas cocois]|nr:major royal jelly family protein [Novacetimonas cocois]
MASPVAMPVIPSPPLPSGAVHGDMRTMSSHASIPSRPHRACRAGAAFALAGVLAMMNATAARAAKPAPPLDPSAPMEEVATSTAATWDRVVVLPDGRIIAEAPAWTGVKQGGLVILDSAKQPHPYPDAAWNDPATPEGQRLTAPTDIQLQDDGTLWVLDSGIAADGTRGQPKVVRIDTRTAQVTATWNIDAAALRPDSRLAAMRVGNGHAYIGDEGVPAIIVADLDGHAQRRLMEHNPALTAGRPIIGPDGRVMKNAAGHTAIVNVSQMAISPDEKWLYFEPLSGPIYKLGTDVLIDPKVTPIELEDSPTLWYKSPPYGGIAVGPDGTLYLNDVSTSSIFRLTPGRIYQRIVTDARLQWPAGSHVTPQGMLYVPAAQLDRTPALNGGQMQVTWPVHVYRINVAALPEAKF